MSSNFDAYHKWLSIPPSEQPPNHYRLLGLGLFESDPDVIAAAGDRQMAHVQTYKNGPHAALSQMLLNEIAAAKLCLLKPARKEIYDEQLRKRAGTQTAKIDSMASAAASAIAFKTPAGVRSSPMPPPPFAVPPQLANSVDEPRRLAPSMTALVAAGGLVILLLVGTIVVAVKLGRSTQTTISSDSLAPRNAAGRSIDAATSEGTAKLDVSKTLFPAPHDSNGQSKPIIHPVSPDVGERKTDANHVASTATPPANPPIAPLATATSDVKPPGSDPGAKARPINDAAKPIPPENMAPKKWIVPDDQAQAAAQKRFAETFGDSSARTVIEKAEPLTDGPLVYVALNTALKAAIDNGDVALVGEITDELIRRFTVDAVLLRAKALIDLRSHIAATPGWEALAGAALPLLDEVVAANRTALAVRLAETSLLAARKSGNMELIRKMTLRVAPLQGQGGVEHDN